MDRKTFAESVWVSLFAGALVAFCVWWFAFLIVHMAHSEVWW